MNVDARIVNAVLMGKQVYNAAIQEEQEAISKWLDEHLFERIRRATEIGSDHVSILLVEVPNTIRRPKATYIRSYVDGVGGLKWIECDSYYARIGWTDDIGHIQ